VIPVRYELEGPAQAPLLVLSNSLGASSQMWAAQIPSLTGRFRVLRYEQRGHGGTAASTGPYTIADLGGDVVDLLDHLGEPTASICGLSLGGMVAMWVAAHHADRVDSLVLSCTAPALGPAGAWLERAATVRAGGPGVLLEGLLARWFSGGFVARRPDVAELVASMLGQVDSEGYAGCCEAIAAMDQRGDLERITASTLVIAGAEDPGTPPSIALGIHSSIKGSSLVVIPRAAHLANVEQPDRYNRALLDHLGGLDVERGRRARREVLGDDHVDRSEAGVSSFNAPFVDMLTRYAWGEIWTRPGIDRRTRSCITLAVLVALGRFDELGLHVRGARRNGLSEDEICEVLLHSALYCGLPAANTAFAVASRALADEAGH